MRRRLVAPCAGDGPVDVSASVTNPPKRTYSGQRFPLAALRALRRTHRRVATVDQHVGQSHDPSGAVRIGGCHAVGVAAEILVDGVEGLGAVHLRGGK